MRNSTKRVLSFALAGTVVAGAPVAAYAANDNTEDVVIEETMPSTTNYIVKEGDTLGKIAEMYYGNAAYYEQLALYNHIENPALIFVGQIITIPRDLTVVYNYDNNVATVVPAYEEDRTYTVQCGDVLDCIVSVQYGVFERELVDKLATYNGLSDPNKIVAGQVLRLPDISKLRQVVQNDYTAQYNEMGWRLNHPRGCRPCNPCNGWLPGYPIVWPAFPPEGCAPVVPEEGPCLKLVP